MFFFFSFCAATHFHFILLLVHQTQQVLVPKTKPQPSQPTGRANHKKSLTAASLVMGRGLLRLRPLASHACPPSPNGAIFGVFLFLPALHFHWSTVVFLLDLDVLQSISCLADLGDDSAGGRGDLGLGALLGGLCLLLRGGVLGQLLGERNEVGGTNSHDQQ